MRQIFGTTLVLAAILLSGCAKNKECADCAKDKKVADACAHCPGVQSKDADGKCSMCHGMMVDGKCTVCDAAGHKM